MRFTNLLFSLFAICLATTAYGNRIYLEYDSGCMDAYEYHYEGNQSNLVHMVYHIKLNDNEKVILEVGVENKLNQPKKPSKTRNCSDLSINERTVRQINSGGLDLYIVKKDGRGYNVSQVGKASYAQINTASTGYSLSDARFSYKFTQPANGIDIASSGSNAEVFFKGTLSHDCPKKYLFSKTSTSGGRNYTEFTLVPEIGIVEQKSGFNENDAKNKVMRLKRINERNLRDYVEFYCRAMESNGAGKFYRLGTLGSLDQPKKRKPTIAEIEAETYRVLGKKPVVSRPPTETGTNTGDTGTTSPGGQNTGSSCSIYKDLDKGLYFDWKTGLLANGECGGNRYVNGYMVGGTTTVPPNTNTGVVIVDEGDTDPAPPPIVNYSECPNVSRYGVHVVQRGETLYGIARQYGLTVNDMQRWNRLSNTSLIKPCMQLLTRAETASTGSPVETNYETKYYTVKRNDTLYGIAKKHGYTVDRMRSMNGMNNSDKIYIGQQLKVSDCNCPADSQVAFSDGNIPTEFEVASERIDTAAPKSVTGKRRFHVVKENDTIYSIAKKHNISVASLRSINDLEENEIIIPYQRIYLEN